MGYDFVQKVKYEAERSFQSSDVVRICRNFICEDITLLQESFRRGNLQRHNHKKQSNNNDNSDSNDTTRKDDGNKGAIIDADQPNPDHAHQEEKSHDSI